MPEKMNAVVCYNPEDYRFEYVDCPRAKDEEVIIKVEGCGICAGDLKAYHGADRFWGGKESWIKAPVIPGHEFYGRIHEIGKIAAKKNELKVGDLITAEQIIPCGKCYYCKHGKYWMCEIHNIYGFQKDIADGGMAEYMKITENSIIHKIPKSLSMEEASLIEPLANAVHVVERAEVKFQDIVVLAGAGNIGLLIVQLLSLKTPKKIVVLDINNERLSIAKKLGADICINPKEENLTEIIHEITDGYGCDIYIEATGSSAGIKQGLNIIRKLGKFIEFSLFREKAVIDWNIISVKKELDIRGSHLSPYTYSTAINLLQRKKIKVDRIVTDIFNLREFRDAFKKAGSSDSIKVLLKP